MVQNLAKMIAVIWFKIWPKWLRLFGAKFGPVNRGYLVQNLSPVNRGYLVQNLSSITRRYLVLNLAQLTVVI